MTFFQFAEGQPDKVLGERSVDFGGQTARDIRRRTPAVTRAPNQSGAAIQTMRLMPFEVVDQDFIRQVINS